jgi:replicative DNA helicase
MKIERIGSVVERVVDRMITGYSIQPVPTLPPTVYKYLNALREHFHPDGVTLIGGSDSDALLKSLMLEMCVESKCPSVTLTTLSHAESMVLWLLSALSSIPIGEILDNRVQPADFEAFNDAAAAIYEAPMFFCTQAVPDLVEFQKEVHGLIQECGAKLIFVDADIPSLNGVETKDALAGLKAIALRDHVQVIARVPADDLLAIAAIGDVGVLVQNQEDGGRLEVFDEAKGVRESVFVYVEDLATPTFRKDAPTVPS